MNTTEIRYKAAADAAAHSVLNITEKSVRLR
jgi:hypothetical protein